MKYFSLFSGIGGFELGIQQAYESSNAHRGKKRGGQENTSADERQGLFTTEGEDPRTKERPVSERLTDIFDERPLCIGFSEIDKYATVIYQKHFPDHKNYGDITTINAEELPDFDLLVGGFPCQAFSIAGKRKGFDDTRGTLFFDIARILRAKQPRLLLLENVKGLLSHDNGQTFRVIIGTLTELGYDVQWQVLNSKNFGVPQNRERVFIIGHLRGTTRPEVFPIIGNNEKDTKQFASNAITANYWKGIDNHGQRTHIGTLRTHKDGQGFREVKSGLAPTIPARAREDGSGQPVIMIPEATKQGFAEACEGDSINLAVPNSKTRRGRVGKGIAQTLDTGMQQYTLQDMQIRRLTPKECERLQGFPDDWTTDISDTQRYKCCGNAVTVNVIREIVKLLITD